MNADDVGEIVYERPDGTKLWHQMFNTRCGGPSRPSEVIIGPYKVIVTTYHNWPKRSVELKDAG